MIYRATHITRHVYEEQVAQSINELRMTPRTFGAQRVRECKFRVEPEPALWRTRRDWFGNEVTTFSIFEPHDRFTITARSVVEVDHTAQSVFDTVPWEDARQMLAQGVDDAALRASEFIFDSRFAGASATLAEFAAPSFPPGRPMAEALADLSHRIHTEFEYVPESTAIDMPLAEIMNNRRGVCQDFAHVMIGALRSLRLAARYVSGYLRSGANFQGAEASHAWVAAFVPGAGWLPLDPTNDTIPAAGHITIGWGRDYGDVTPVKGITLGGGAQHVDVSVRVDPAE